MVGVLLVVVMMVFMTGRDGVGEWWCCYQSHRDLPKPHSAVVFPTISILLVVIIMMADND